MNDFTQYVDDKKDVLTKKDFSLTDEFCSLEELAYLKQNRLCISELRRLSKMMRDAALLGKDFVTVQGAHPDTLNALSAAGFNIDVKGEIYVINIP